MMNASPRFSFKPPKMGTNRKPVCAAPPAPAPPSAYASTHECTAKSYPRALNYSEILNHKKQTDEYASETLQYNYEMSQKFRANFELLTQQPEISLGFRIKLIEFLFKIAMKLKITPFVTFKAVKLFDRYCSKRIVLGDQSQLVVCTCLWLAAKITGGYHQSSYAPHSNILLKNKPELPTRDSNFRLPKLIEFVKLCGKSCNYDEGMFVQMELHILQTLNWELHDPNVDEFLLTITDNQHCLVDDNQYEVYKIKQFMSYVALFVPEMIDVSCYHTALVIKELINELLELNSYDLCYQNTAFNVTDLVRLGTSADYSSDSPSSPSGAPSIISSASSYARSMSAASSSSASSYSGDDDDFFFETDYSYSAVSPPSRFSSPFPRTKPRLCVTTEEEPLKHRLSFEAKQRLKKALVTGVLEHFEFFYMANVFTSQLKGIKKVVQKCYELKLLQDQTSSSQKTVRSPHYLHSPATFDSPMVGASRRFSQNYCHSPYMGSGPPLPGFRHAVAPYTPVTSANSPITPESSMPPPNLQQKQSYQQKQYSQKIANT